MFGLWHLKRSVPFARTELRRLHELLEVYERTPAGEWLDDLPWRAFRFHWCDTMRDGDVMGAYSPVRGNVIYLQPGSGGSDDSVRFWVSLIASTAVHELRHAWQHARHPWLYTLCGLPLVREFTLECDARRIQNVADDLFQHIEANRAEAAFAARPGGDHAEI